MSVVSKVAISASLALAAVSSHAVATVDTNVAFNGTVTLDGAGFGAFSAQWGAGSLANAQTVTDGQYLPNNQQWNIGTLFWNGAGGGEPNTSFTVQLLQKSSVTGFALQADNNDDYGVEYKNAQGNWIGLITLSPHRSGGLDFVQMTLAAPVVTDAFRIKSVGGDGFYSVSEFQALGAVVAVPEPETYAMLLAGLGVIATVAKRRRVIKP